MSYFLLPYIKQNIDIENIECTYSDEEDFNATISKSLKYYLNNIKHQIGKCPQQWDIYKKYTNPYEHVHTNLPGTTQAISKLKPISRSFYKMIEICNILQITDGIYGNINSFHLAEGPGGFIEALIYLRDNEADNYYGMTLIDNDVNKNIPGWRKSKYLLENHDNITIENGSDGTGNLFNKENFLYCHKKYKGSINIITADGGFDFSVDFNKQEVMSHNLIFSEICYAIAMQKKGGSFILKVYDIFTQGTIDLLYILSNFYTKVYIFKPNTSRYANSERYIICKNFTLNDTTNFVKQVLPFFDNINKTEEEGMKYVKRFLNVKIPYIYINKLEEYNAILGQQQIENLSLTLNFIKNNKMDKLELVRKHNIVKCNYWCQKYRIPYNKCNQQTNIFLLNKELY